MKAVTLFILLFSCLSVQAGEILKCKSANWNSSYKFNITSKYPSKLYGSLTKEIPDLYQTNKEFKGEDPLEFRLNPSNCKLRVLSENNSSEQFVVTLDTSASNNNSYTGSIAGSFVVAQKMECMILENEFSADIQKSCHRHNSLDQEISFSSTQQLAEISASNTNNISDISGVKINDETHYPEFKETVYQAIIEY